MYYGNIKKTDIANGTGVRVSLFVSGCRRHCKDCFNSETWDFCYGNEFTDDTMNEIITAMDKEYIFSHLAPVLAYLAYTLFIYAVWIAGVVLFLVFLKKYKLNKVPLERDGLLPASNERMRLCCVNAGMIVSFVFCLYLMVTSLL